MNNDVYVAEQIAVMKQNGIPYSEVAWKAALLCVGWPYVFGANGQECTPSYRKTAYNAHGADHPTIKTKCQNLSDGKACTGCQWYPDAKRVRCFDCRGFTYWILLQVYDWKLQGAGATSQWNTASNWSAKGEIAAMPRNTLCCLFVKKGNKMEHTGFGFNDETIEASSGVQHFTTRNKKWTHWAIPVCVNKSPEPAPEPEKGYAIVTGKNLALRQGPSTSNSIITRAPTGSKVKIEEVPSEWVYVSYGNKKGFMMKQYLKET